MAKIGSKYVPSVGNEDSDIMFVGEAPGQKEVREREPFVGRSGSLLTRYLERLGLQRDDVFLTNLSKHRPGPRSNNFKRLLGTKELEMGLAELEAEIREVDPNVIVALGGWPMYFLTGQTGTTGKKGRGVTQLRGSVVPCTLVEGYKVAVAFHPAYVLRAWSTHPIFLYDLEMAKREMDFPDIRYPEYESIIDPPEDQLAEITGEMLEADWLSVDIETFRDNTISCVGIADSADRGLCITYQYKGGWEYAKALFECDARKIFQFGTYDMNFVERFYNFETGGYYVDGDVMGWDTYIAAASLMPEFDRGLDFLASVYTDFPFYKEDRKKWKEEGDLQILWEYNIKDIIATWIIAAKQMREMEDKFNVTFEPKIPI